MEFVIKQRQSTHGCQCWIHGGPVPSHPEEYRVVWCPVHVVSSVIFQCGHATYHTYISLPIRNSLCPDCNDLDIYGNEPLSNQDSDDDPDDEE